METAVATDLPATQQQAALTYPQGMPVGPQWAEESDGGEGLSIASLLHSLRRQWLPALGIGIVVATLLSALLWLLIPVEFQAEAVLRVNRDETFKKGGGTISDYMTYKETQATLLKSSFVLSAALRDNDISQLPMVKLDGFGRRRLRPVAWLGDEIKVDLEGGSELIRVRMGGKDKAQTEKILDAVVKAYQAEIVTKERLEKVDMLAKLRRRYRETRDQVKQKSDEVIDLAKQLGTTNNNRIQAQQTILLNELSSARQEHERLSRQYADTAAQYRLIVLGAQIGTSGPTEHAIADELERDAEYYNLRLQIRQLKDEVKRLSGVLRPNSSQLQQIQQEIGFLERKQADLKKELTPRVIARIKSREGVSDDDQRREILLKQQEIKNLTELVKVANDGYVKKLQEVRAYGGNSGELESRSDELLALRREVQTVYADKTQLEIELDGQERIQVMQEATTPHDSNWKAKLGQVIGAWIVSLAGVIVAVAYWDYLGKRVNNSEDLTRSIRVVGTMPAVQQTGLPFLKMSREALEEAMRVSVDGIRTALLYNRERQSQVIMVASATGQEGRSTVASQLAVSFGRSGKRTLIVDGDLRSPQQHAIFAVQPSTGFCEMLRDEQTADDAIVPTAVENVWLLTAGRCDQFALQVLSGDQANILFQDLRERFDVIVMDSSPVLTSADSLLLGQHADAAIISVRRDISQMPKVNAAADRLTSVGVFVLGAVVNGTDVELRRGELGVAEGPEVEQPALTNE